MARVRSWLAAPAGARLLGMAFALAGIGLLVLGVFAFGGSGSGDGSAAAPGPSVVAPTTPSVTAVSPSPPSSPLSPSSPAPTTAAPTSQLPATTPPPPPQTGRAPVRGPLTVLNNSTIRGLGERAAAQARAKGWQVASVGNFAGVLPATTVYYTPGDAAQQQAAERLRADLPQVARVLPRYEGLPPTPTGVVLVVTRDWS